MQTRLCMNNLQANYRGESSNSSLSGVALRGQRKTVETGEKRLGERTHNFFVCGLSFIIVNTNNNVNNNDNNNNNNNNNNISWLLLITL